MGSCPGTSVEYDDLMINRQTYLGYQQIFKFLEHVTANGYLYDVPDDRVQSLRRMLDEIRMLW